MEGSSSVPRLLFLDSFLQCMDKSSWKWPLDQKMNVLGCLILQTVFKFPSQYMQLYAKSMLLLEEDQVFKIANDPGGSRVLESFLCSDVSAKVKLKVISKLRGHFGELSLHPSSSFTVEKCSAASNLFFKEVIVKELSAVKDELAKAKHGPHVIKNLEIERYMRRPDQWKSRQVSKEAIYREYQTTFGSQGKEGKAPPSPKSCSIPAEKRGKGHKRPRQQDESFEKLGFSSKKHGSQRGKKRCESRPSSKNPSKDFIRKEAAENCFVRRGKKTTSSSGLADMAAKRNLSSNDMRKLFKSSSVNHKKRPS